MRGTRLVTTLTILTALAFFTPAQAERTPGGDSISVFVDAPLANLGFSNSVDYQPDNTAQARFTQADSVQKPDGRVALVVDARAVTDPVVELTLEVVNGMDMDLPVFLRVNAPVQNFDDKYRGKVEVKVVVEDFDVNGTATVTPTLEDFDNPGSFILVEGLASAQDLLNPPFIRTFGQNVGGKPFSDSPLGVGTQQIVTLSLWG